jgi:two-component system, chemotaxis family, chemotaxis protein CheY
MKTCLVVDDSRVIRMVARKVLQEMQFNVREAANGQDALAQCCEEMPDAVLLDWNMPVMDGIQFLEALRQMPDGDVPVVVFCTTENDMTQIQRALDLGASEYIMKPFDSEILQMKFAQVGLLD